jgi:hypothetical protein
LPRFGQAERADPSRGDVRALVRPELKITARALHAEGRPAPAIRTALDIVDVTAVEFSTECGRVAGVERACGGF